MADRTYSDERASLRRRQSADTGAEAAAPPHPLLKLQRQLGNRQVGRMLQRQPEEDELQAKRDASVQRQPEEEELQAKRDASVQRQSEEDELQAKRDLSVQRNEGGEAEDEEMAMTRDSSLQRDAAPEVGLAGGELSPETARSINDRRGAGSPLDGPTLGKMESAFDADLSDVRVHTDGASAQLNRSVGAKAFTVGSDIFFGAGAAPSDGQLLAHEMTHVVQQRTGGGGGGGAMRVTAANDQQEQEADAAAAAINTGAVQRHAEQKHDDGR